MRRAANAGNIAMTQLQQMPGRQVSAVFMVNAHQVRIDPFQASVDDHHRRAHPRQPLGQAAISPGRSHDQPVDALLQQHAQVTALLVRVVIGIAEDHAIAIALAVVLDTPGQLREIGVEAVRHQQADGRGVFRFQRTGDRAGHVVELLDGGLDFQPHLFTDRSRLVHHMGNRGVGNTRKRRHILNRCHGSAPSTCAAAAIGVQHHRDHDDRTSDDALGGFRRTDLRQPRRQYGDDQDTEKGADH
ncbi:hypothetical protein D3C78_821650 [compost metagenome]